MLDDYVHLVGENNLMSVSAWSLFSDGFNGFYRPLAFLFLRTVLFLFGPNPLVYHAYNFLLFYAISLMFYYMVRFLSKNEELALLTACLYAVHPIHQMLINYKTAGNNSITILCMQLSTWSFLKYFEAQKKYFYIFSILGYFLSLLAHEMSFMLPVYLFLIMYFLKDVPLRKNFTLCLPYLIAFVIYLFLRWSVNGPSGIENIFSLRISFFPYLATLTKLLGWYLSKLLLPVNILFIWDERISSHFSWHNGVLPGILGLTFLWALVKGKKDFKSFAYCFFIAGLTPSLLASFVYTSRMQTAIIEPHWFEYSSIGFFVLAALFFLSLRKFLNPQVWLTIIAFAIGLLSFLTYQSNFVWKDEKTYCLHWLKLNSLNGSAWHGLANAYLREKDQGLDKTKYPDCRVPSFLAGAYHVKGNVQTALQYYDLALKMNPSCAFVFYGWGVLLSDTGDQKQAHLFFDKAKDLNPDLYPIYQLLGDVFENQHEQNTAMKIKYFIDRINPQHSTWLEN